MEDDLLNEWNDAVRIVSDWAAHNGLSVRHSEDASRRPTYDPVALVVELRPLPDSCGVTVAAACVAQLVVHRYEDPDGRELIRPVVEVLLSRHGRGARDPVAVSPYELHRFTVEARHLDRID